MKILVTGAAGFIGSATIGKLIEHYGHDIEIVGLDNLNEYYSPALKVARLLSLGFTSSDFRSGSSPITAEEIAHNILFTSKCNGKLHFIKTSLQDWTEIERLFKEFNFDYVIHLGAQAGVRYSIDHPREYIESNVTGFLNILEGCRHYKVKHLVYASSSSIYGLNQKIPFSEKDPTSHPVSLYAATKKSNELMAHSYSYLYGLPVTGLRFFTVYGPWGRPDMSPFLFIDAVLKGNTIKVFNNGDMWRDFTYIDDVTEGIVRVLTKIPEGNPNWNGMVPNPAESTAPFRLFNIGNSKPINLKDYIETIEKCCGLTAKKEYLPMQSGDVYQTYADSSALANITEFHPNTPLKEGIAKTVGWYKNYYNL
ncbi:MAG: NAD-dependent epimerase/dehydratase family protein [Muribaculaceae bacterium]|nr:NAD-dependent epimerase/dehydratase family protein [Muribaculaceae bacterium]